MPRRRRFVTFGTTCCICPARGALRAPRLLVPRRRRRDGPARKLAGVLRRIGRPARSCRGPGRPRSRSTIRGQVRSWPAGPPPSLRRIAIEVNRLGVLERRGLPPARSAGCAPRAPRRRSTAVAARWSAKAGSAASSSCPNRTRPRSAAASSPSTARLPDGRPGDPRPPLHVPPGAAHLRPRLLDRPRPRHLRHPPRRHRPGEDAPHRPHHLLLPAPAPQLHGRRRTAQLPQRRLPGPGRFPQRHLPPGPHLLRLRRPEDGLRHAGAAPAAPPADGGNPRLLAKGFLSKLAKRRP